MWWLLYKVGIIVGFATLIWIPYAIDQWKHKRVIANPLIMYYFLMRTVYLLAWSPILFPLIPLYFMFPLEYLSSLLVPLFFITPAQSHDLEIIDGTKYSETEYRENLKDMGWISMNLGSKYFHINEFKEFDSLIDLGCGGGWFLHHLEHLYPTKTLTGVDLNPKAIEIAQETALTAKFLVKDLNDMEPVDIITCSMFFHHIPRGKIPSLIKLCYSKSKKQLVIRDLERSSLSLFFFKFIINYYFFNRLTRNDGYLSILRSYTRSEWQDILTETGIPFKIYRLPFDQLVITLEK